MRLPTHKNQFRVSNKNAMSTRLQVPHDWDCDCDWDDHRHDDDYDDDDDNHQLVTQTPMN